MDPPPTTYCVGLLGCRALARARSMSSAKPYVASRVGAVLPIMAIMKQGGVLPYGAEHCLHPISYDDLSPRDASPREACFRVYLDRLVDELCSPPWDPADEDRPTSIS